MNEPPLTHDQKEAARTAVRELTRYLADDAVLYPVPGVPELILPPPWSWPRIAGDT